MQHNTLQHSLQHIVGGIQENHTQCLTYTAPIFKESTLLFLIANTEVNHLNYFAALPVFTDQDGSMLYYVETFSRILRWLLAVG